jgi:hypothetical protein
MKPIFEIKYIEVQWYDEETITKVTESLSNLSLEYNNKTKIFECETTIYPNTQGLRGQLGVRILDNSQVNPYIELPKGQVKNLSPIKDIDTGRTWWIVKDSWDKQNQFWRHTGINTAGKLKFVLQNQRCHVFIGAMDFTYDELEIYLSSFKDDLWELMLDDSSAIQTNKPTNGIGVNESLIKCINHLISHAEKVLETPKVELREIQDLKPRKAVKPVNRTFMEIVSKTNQRFLTSRATIPSFNVSENRYVLFALERSYRIIKQISILSGNKSKRYIDMISKLESQYYSFSDYITVDRDLVVRDYKTLRERSCIEFWQKKLILTLEEYNINLNTNFNGQEIFIRTRGYTTNKESNDNDGFFIEIFRNGIWDKDNGKTTILSFRYTYQALLQCLEPNTLYRIIAQVSRNEYTNFVSYSISRLNQIEIIESDKQKKAQEALEKEEEQAILLSQNGWKRQLSQSEQEEQEKEKTALMNRVNFYYENQKRAEYVFKQVAPKQKQILKIIKALRKLDIKSSSYFPNSMTFVQNPHYQGVHNGYRVLREATNLVDEDILVHLEEIDSIGLVNMPLLYERWCLLQIIKVLKESFRFILKTDWKYQLINAVKMNKIDIEVKLANTDSKRFITLTYEKTLDSGKRPDFVIDLEWYLERDVMNEHPHFKRFVLDAKFYNKATFEKFGGLMGVADQLYNKKNYRELTDNPVFIIHPCKTALPERVTSQEWGKYSFLGELPIGGSEPVKHQYGGVFLNPIDKNLYTDELQRLFGLFLQYKLEDSNTMTNGLSDDRTISKPFCIRCGSSNLLKIEKTLGYYDRQNNWVTRTHRSVWMQCGDCKQFISFNHCRISKTRLIKNGIYWTYQSARAIEPFNIKCPDCGEWGGW